MAIESAYKILFIVSLIILAFAIVCMIIKAIIGPKAADRLISINAVSSLVVCVLAILAFYLQEKFILDVCLIYVLIGFFAVMVLTSTFINAYRKKTKDKKEEGGKDGVD
ncbi:MAG: monovalent cation/H+ antiporter complex subunit F [Christensenella sp.]|nr:monovalent cation/H+ antiporter complex subunit F [Christensenella sp.]